jgi:uncharacterized delta-60 repeat protein
LPLTPTPTNTSTPTNTPTPNASVTPTRAPFLTPTRTQIPTGTPVSTVTPTRTPFVTRTPTGTNFPGPQPASSSTPTLTPSNTETPTNTPTNTKTPTNTPTPDITPSNTPSNTPTKTPLPSFGVTQNATPTQTPTPTNTPTVTSNTACTQTSYCVFTGLSGFTNYDGTYYNYGVYDGFSLFYAPNTTAQGVIYYNTGETRWCISTIPGGTCLLFGVSPSTSLCPDLDSTYFNTICPTPTPSNRGLCNTFSFDAIFDCINTGLTPTSSVTITPTKTPTQTPTQTNNCAGKSVTVSAINFNYIAITPTPSTTPINTNQNCLVTGNTEFGIFNSSFISGLNKLLTDCTTGKNYIVSSSLPFNTGATFNAIIDGKGVCVTYVSDFFGAPLNKLEEIQSGNLIECLNCVPVPSQTSTPANTPTPTLTPTVSVTPSLTPCLQTGIDFTFINSGGLIPNDKIERIKKLSDGKYIIVGSFTQYNSTSVSGIVKITTNGVADTSFSTSSGFSSVTYSEFSPFDVVEQSDGKLVCGGAFESFSGISRNYLCRLNSDGTLDTSYTVGSGFNGPVFRMGIQSDNKVICVGDFTSYDGTSVGYICRINSDGTLDNSFGAYIGFDAYPFDLQILSDNSIILGGYFTTYNSVYLAPYIIKLLPDGNVDTSFTPGTGFNGPVLTVYVDSEEKIYASGNFSGYSVYGTSLGLIKLDLSGTPDSTFTTNIGTSFSFGYALNIEETLDSSLILSLFSGTTFNGYANGGIVKISKSGVFDSQFYANPGFNNTVVDIIIDDNNKIICVGNFTTFNGTIMNGVVKLQPCQYNIPSSTPTNTPTQTPTVTQTINCPNITTEISLMSSPYHISIDSTNGTRIVTEVFLGYQGKVSIYSSANTFVYTYDVDYDVQPTYINEDYDYLFIPSYNENKVYVFSTNYLTPLYELTGFSGPNSVAFDPINDRTYVVNSENNTISVLDSNSLSEIGLLGVSDCYLGNIVYDSFNQLMIVTGIISSTISTIDINTYNVTTIGNTYASLDKILIFNSNDNYVYIPIIDSTIIVMDFQSNNIVNYYNYSSYGSTITNQSLDINRNYLYLGIQPNTVLTYNLNSYSLINVQTFPSITQLSEVVYSSYDDNLYLLDQGNNTVKVVCAFTYPTTPLPTPDPTATPTPSITPFNTLTPFPTPTRTPDVTSTVTPSITPTNTTTPSITPSTTLAPYCPYSFDSVTISSNLISLTNDTYNNYVWAINKFSGYSYDSSYNLVSTVGLWAASPTASVFDSINNRVYVAVASDVDSIDVTTSTLTPAFYSFSGTVYDLAIYNTLLAVADNTNSGVDIYDTGAGFVGTVYTSTPPTKLVWDNSGYIYVIDDSTELYIISWLTLTIVSTLTLGSSNIKIIFVPYNNYIYILDSSITLWYVDTSTFTVAGSIDLSSYTYPYGLTYNNIENYIYIGEAGSDLITIDVVSNTIIQFKQNVRVGSGGSILNYNPSDTTIWFGDDSSTTVDILCSVVSPIIPTPTPTPTNTSTPSVTPTNTNTQSITPTNTNTPTQSNTPTTTNTPTNTNTPSPTTACPLVLGNTSTGYDTSLGYSYSHSEYIQSDIVNSNQYFLSTNGIQIYSSGGTLINTLSVTGESQTFDTILNKLYSSYSSGGLHYTTIISADTQTIGNTLSLTGFTGGFSSPGQSCYDNINGKIGVLNTGPINNKVAIIDSTTETIDGYITIQSGVGYKGVIAFEEVNVYMWVRAGGIGSSPINVIDPLLLTTATTFNHNSSGLVTSMIYNPTNQYMYILESGSRVSYFDVSSYTLLGNINISSYSGQNYSMTYNVNQDYLYVSNIQSPTTQGIIIIDCSTNTVVNFKNSIESSSGNGTINYNPTSTRLWHITTNNKKLLRLCT